jgi:hypothetical protein
MGFCLDCHRDPAAHVREKDIFNLDSLALADQGKLEAGPIRARLEGQTAAKLLRLPSLMKRKFEHPAPSNGRADRPEVLAQPRRARGDARLPEHWPANFPRAPILEGVDRRQFMKIMAASFALGGLGLAGCRRPEAHILPYGKSVEGTVPGLPLYFATAMPLRKLGHPAARRDPPGPPDQARGQPELRPARRRQQLLAQASSSISTIPSARPPTPRAAAIDAAP